MSELKQRLRWAGLSHVGMRRVHQEDALVMLPARGVFAVVDGMGGHSSGDIPARLVTRGLAELLAEAQPGELGGLAAVLVRCGERVWRMAEEDATRRGHGATAAAIWLDEGGGGQVVHAGDSRVYRWRRGALAQLTEDHSLLNRVTLTHPLSASELDSFAYRHVVTSTFGFGAVPPELGVQPLSWEEGDVYVVCTDGLFREDEAMIGRVLSRLEGGDVERLCAALMAEALALEASDNVTVVVVGV